MADNEEEAEQEEAAADADDPTGFPEAEEDEAQEEARADADDLFEDDLRKIALDVINLRADAPMLGARDEAKVEAKFCGVKLDEFGRPLGGWSSVKRMKDGVTSLKTESQSPRRPDAGEEAAPAERLTCRDRYVHCSSDVQDRRVWHLTNGTSLHVDNHPKKMAARAQKLSEDWDSWHNKAEDFPYRPWITPFASAHESGEHYAERLHSEEALRREKRKERMEAYAEEEKQKFAMQRFAKPTERIYEKVANRASRYKDLWTYLHDDARTAAERREKLREEHLAQHSSLANTQFTNGEKTVARVPAWELDGKQVAREKQEWREKKKSEQISKEMEGCTFRPKIGEVAKHFMIDVQSMFLKKARRAYKLQREVQALQDEEMSSCTFRPEILQKSREIISRTRGLRERPWTPKNHKRGDAEVQQPLAEAPCVQIPEVIHEPFADALKHILSGVRGRRRASMKATGSEDKDARSPVMSRIKRILSRGRVTIDFKTCEVKFVVDLEFKPRKYGADPAFPAEFEFPTLVLDACRDMAEIQTVVGGNLRLTNLRDSKQIFVDGKHKTWCNFLYTYRAALLEKTLAHAGVVDMEAVASNGGRDDFLVFIDNLAKIDSTAVLHRGVKLLKTGLRSGEVGQLVDQFEDRRSR